MDVILWAIDLIWEIVSSFLTTVMNLKIFEYGSGDLYIAVRVYHFVFLEVALDIVFLILYSYFKKKGD